jgi:hypothetical protein
MGMFFVLRKYMNVERGSNYSNIAPVTDQNKLDRSVISKDHTGNRKLNLEMVDRSRL